MVRPGALLRSWIVRAAASRAPIPPARRASSGIQGQSAWPCLTPPPVRPSRHPCAACLARPCSCSRVSSRRARRAIRAGVPRRRRLATRPRRRAATQFRRRAATQFRRRAATTISASGSGPICGCSDPMRRRPISRPFSPRTRSGPIGACSPRATTPRWPAIRTMRRCVRSVRRVRRGAATRTRAARMRPATPVSPAPPGVPGSTPPRPTRRRRSCGNGAIGSGPTTGGRASKRWTRAAAAMPRPPPMRRTISTPAGPAWPGRGCCWRQATCPTRARCATPSRPASATTRSWCAWSRAVFACPATSPPPRRSGRTGPGASSARCPTPCAARSGPSATCSRARCSRRATWRRRRRSPTMRTRHPSRRGRRRCSSPAGSISASRTARRRRRRVSPRSAISAAAC